MSLDVAAEVLRHLSVEWEGGSSLWARSLRSRGGECQAL